MKRFALAACLMAVAAPVTGAFTLVPAVAMAQATTYKVAFALGSARLDAAANKAIADAAAAFKAGGSPNLTVIGRTDTTGSAEYNQRLSERRAKAVSDALVANGVAQSAITVDAVGQTQLIVATADNVNEPRNRVVTIDVNPRTAAPAPVAAAPAPVGPVVSALKRFQFSVGPYYGYNGAQADNLLGGNFSGDYWISDNISIGGEQAMFYAFDAEGVGGRSVASIDYHFGRLTDVVAGGVDVYVGVNAGGIYGKGVNDDFIYGPEIGLTAGGFVGKLAYDISDAGIDDSTVSATIGYLFRF
jgi:hypothetical protein